MQKTLKLPNTLTVQYHGAEVGKLTMSPDNRHCVFQYSAGWLSDGFSISPLELPLKPDLFVPRTGNFYGNFGIFEDSMPDGYGNYLLDRILKEYGLSLSGMTPVERLSFVGEKGMGALCYIPQMRINSAKDSSTLDEMQQAALDVLSEKDFSKTETLYANSGNSGGCRPKCLWNDKDGFWLVKFRHTYDPADIGIKEYNTLKLASKCGISVPDMKLFNGKYLGTRRFDIEPDGTRLHVATASGLLCESTRYPSMDYTKLLRFTRMLTESSAQTREMFRRMLFNYAIGNNDDHAKNFSFVCVDGYWSISPAYDITVCREANNGHHSTLANGKEFPEERDFLAVASAAGLTKSDALDEIENVRDIIEKEKTQKTVPTQSRFHIPLKKGRGI